MIYRSGGRLWGIVILLLVGSIAIPTILHAVSAALPAIIAVFVLIAVGIVLFERTRRW